MDLGDSSGIQGMNPITRPLMSLGSYLGRNFGMMQDGRRMHEGGIVLYLGANIQDAQSTIDFQDDMGTLADLQSHVVADTSGMEYDECNECRGRWRP